MITAKSSYVDAYAAQLLAACRRCILERDIAGAAQIFAVLLKQVRRFPAEIAELGLLLLSSGGDFTEECEHWVAAISRFSFVKGESLLLQYVDYLLQFGRGHAAYDALQLFLVSRNVSARAHFRAGDLALRIGLGLVSSRPPEDAGTASDTQEGGIDAALQPGRGDTVLRRLWLRRAVSHLEKAHELDNRSLVYAARLVEALVHDSERFAHARAGVAAVFRARRALDPCQRSAEECVELFQRLSLKAMESARARELLVVAREVWKQGATAAGDVLTQDATQDGTAGVRETRVAETCVNFRTGPQPEVLDPDEAWPEVHVLMRLPVPPRGKVRTVFVSSRRTIGGALPPARIVKHRKRKV